MLSSLEYENLEKFKILTVFENNEAGFKLSRYKVMIKLNKVIIFYKTY